MSTQFGVDPGYYPPPAPERATFPRNGLGMTSLILGILGVLAGLGTITFVVALVLGVIGTVFGFVGRARVGRREATNPVQATTGLALSILSIVLSILMPVLVLGRVVNDVQDRIGTKVGTNSGQIQQQYLDCINKLDANDPDYINKMAACTAP